MLFPANVWKISVSQDSIVTPRCFGTWAREDTNVIKQEPDAKELDFLKELEKHVNKWVAITGYGSDQESIVASGDSILEARQKAESLGFKDTTFFKVPPTDKLFIPLVPM